LDEIIPNSVACWAGGSGSHTYFSYEPGYVIRSGLIAPDVKIHADGGYVVVPPSIDSSGREYEWAHDLDTSLLAAAPHYLFELMLRHGIAVRDAVPKKVE
jgi:hypothetical protein